MRGHETQRPVVDLDFNPNHAATLGFSFVLVLAVVNFQNRKARKDRDAVLSALIIEIVSKRVFHLRHTRKLGDLVQAFGSLYAAINLLQTNEVGMLLVDRVGDALQVQLLVHAYADMNVVGHHPELRLEAWRTSSRR